MNVPSSSALVDSSELHRLEAIISKGWETFLTVGRALRDIRDKGLYRPRYKTFAEYCLGKWRFSRSEGHRQIQAVVVVEELSAGPEKFAILPVNVGQTRELARVKTAKMKRKIWAALISSKENPTAQCIRRAVVEFLPPKTARRKKVTLPVVFPASAIVDICEDMRLAVKSGDLRKLSAQINAMRNIIKSHQADLKAAP
jgi:hypothetical protein